MHVCWCVCVAVAQQCEYSRCAVQINLSPTPAYKQHYRNDSTSLLLPCCPVVPPSLPPSLHPSEIAGDASVAEAAAAYDRAQAAARRDDRLEVEVDFKWVGEPNISFFVELALAG
jgi:hypothetical protein